MLRFRDSGQGSNRLSVGSRAKRTATWYQWGVKTVNVRNGRFLAIILVGVRQCASSGDYQTLAARCRRTELGLGIENAS